MKVLARYFFGSIALAAVAMAAGFITASAWIGVIAALLVAGLWIIARARQQTWSTNAGLSAYVVLAMLAAWLHVHPIWMLISIGAITIAWDVDHFQQKRSQIGSVIRGHDLIRAHVQRLLLVEFVGLLLAALAMLVDVRIGFWIAVPLAVLMFSGINLLLRCMRSEG